MADITLDEISCCSCGVVFGMPSALKAQRKGDHGEFYCPNGHGQHWPQRTKADELQVSLDKAKLQILEERTKRIAAEKRVRTVRGFNRWRSFWIGVRWVLRYLKA